MERPPKPAALTCPQCGSVIDAWVWSVEDGEWDWEDEWWRDPQWPHGTGGLRDYTCSRRCHVNRGQAEAVTP